MLACGKWPDGFPQPRLRTLEAGLSCFCWELGMCRGLARLNMLLFASAGPVCLECGHSPSMLLALQVLWC